MGNPKLVYYSQEDKRWGSLPYTVRRDPKQTIGTSACGPTSFAMAASSLLGREILPPEAAKYAVEHGYRTDNNGTAWDYFEDVAKHYGLTCKQTGKLNEVKAALTEGALAVASMRSGHFTGGGHYVLLVGANGDGIDVYDPNHDNRKYGADGRIVQGVKDDGEVRAKESVIRREAGQYWIITKPMIIEEDQPMTAEEKKAFEALTARVEALEERKEAPAWFVNEFGSADLCGKIKNPQLTVEGWRVLAIGLRARG